MNPGIINWLNNFFNKYNQERNTEINFQENYLIFSDMLPTNPFYLGDFYFAGTKNDMISFCRSILEFPTKNLHPSIGTDYILKYLISRDRKFHQYFLKIFH